MKLYTQIILSTYVFLPAICILLSPTLIMSLAKAQQQKAKLMAGALTARTKAATALARNNARYLHKRLIPNTKYSSDLNIHDSPFNFKRTRRQAVQMPMESQQLRSDLVKRKSHLNQEVESMTTLQNLWNMNNFGTPSNVDNSMRHVRREEPYNENIPIDGNSQLNHDKGSGSFFIGRNVYDTIVNQANPLNNNEEDYIETNETFDEHPNDFVDPLSNEDFSERTSKKPKKKKHRHRPHSSYGRSSDAPVMIMENPEEIPMNPQLIPSMEARKSKKGHSRGHGSANSYYGRESDLLEHIIFAEPTLQNEFNAHAEERSPTKKSKKNKGHSWSYYDYGRTGEVGVRKSKKQHSHENFNSYYGRESGLPEEMIPSDPTLMTPLWVEFGDMEARTHKKKSKKKHGSMHYYGRNGESILELETPIDPQLMATTEVRKSKNGHSCGHGNNNCYYSRQGDLPEEMITNEPNLPIHMDSEGNLKPELRSQYHPNEYYARNNGELVGKVPQQTPASQDPLVVVSENKVPIGTIPPPPQNSNMALVATDPQTQMRVVQDPILASKADPRCKDEDGKEKFNEYYTPPLMPEIIDPNKYYQHTMEQVEELNKKMAKATESLLYHPHGDTLHIPDEVSSYVRPPNPQYIDEIPQVTPYYEKSANPHHHHRGFSHTHTHTLTHSHEHIPNVHIGNDFAHSGAYANAFSHSKANGFSPTRGLAEAQVTAGNGFHGYGGGFNQAEAEAKALANHGRGFNGYGRGFSQTEAQANALANGGGGFNGYGGGFSHANAQAKALSGGGLNPVGPVGGGFSQADTQSKAQSGIGFGQYTNGFAQAGASSHDLGFGQSQANAQAISQSANNGFGQAASQALAQASSGTQAAPQFFQVLGPSSFVNAHARDATPLNDLSKSDVTHEIESGKGRFSRAHGSDNDAFGGLNVASGIVNSALDLGSMLQPKRRSFNGGEVAGKDKNTMDFIKNIVDSSIKAGGRDDENEEVIDGNGESFDALEGSEMRIKRESGSKGENINQSEQEGLNLASGIVHSVLDQSSRMQPNEKKMMSENQANSLGENAYFPSGNLASLVHSVIKPTMSRLAADTKKFGIDDTFEKTMNPNLPATNSENQKTFNFDSDVVHSVMPSKSLLPSNTFHSHPEPKLSDPQHISKVVQPEDSSLRANTGNAMDQLNTNLKSLRARSEDAQFRKRNIDSKEHDNLTLMINPDDISIEEEVRTETSLTEPPKGTKIKNNSEKPMQEANDSSLMPHIHNTQLLSNIDQEMHKTQLADNISRNEPNDHFGNFVGPSPIVASTTDKLEEAAKQDHKDEIVGMPVPHFRETVTDISSIIKRKSPLKPNSSEESSEEKTKEDKQKQFSKPTTMSTSNNAAQSTLTSTMAPSEIENGQFTIPVTKEQFNKTEDITEVPMMNSTNAKAVTEKNTTGVLAENEEQSSDKGNSTNLLGNLEDVMKQLNEDEKNVFIKQEKDLIEEILGNNLHNDRTLKPEQVKNSKESQSDPTVASPHLFQAKSNNFHEEWERVHHEYARKSRSPVEKALDTILGAQREKVGQIQKEATGDDDLLMISKA